MRLFDILLLAAVIGLPAVAAEKDIINGVAVIVDDKVITYQEVELYIAPALEVLLRQYGNRPQELRQKLSEARQDGTEQLVSRQLILREFKTAGYSLPESIIDDTIKERIQQKFGDRATLARSLKEQGITYETFRQRTRDEIIVDALRQKNMSAELIISPQKIVNFYQGNQTNYAVADEVKLRMIVLNKPAADQTGETRKLAQEILGKIKEGASFEDMARIHSEGSQRAVGGDWGWVERSILREELADVAFKLEKGQVGQPVELPGAIYIMIVEDKRAARIKPLSEVRDQIEKELLARERQRIEKKWLDRLRTKAFVRYFS